MSECKTGTMGKHEELVNVYICDRCEDEVRIPGAMLGTRPDGWESLPGADEGRLRKVLSANATWWCPLCIDSFIDWHNKPRKSKTTKTSKAKELHS